jgi:hypothetical protein
MSKSAKKLFLILLVVAPLFLSTRIMASDKHAIERINLILDDTIPAPIDTIPVTDPDAFTIDSARKWTSLNTYLASIGDSVELELILKRTEAQTDDWFKLAKVGRVKKRIAPKEDQFFLYNMARNTWFFQIDNSGTIYCRLVTGSIANNSTIYVPLQVKYKL